MNKTIKYTKVASSEHSQQTLGPNSGVRIETDQVLLEPLLLERDAPNLWEVYKNHPQLFDYMPHGPCHTYEQFHAIHERFCSDKSFSNWVCYVSSPAPADEQKQWVLCGSICLLDIDLRFRKCEVGAIWLHPSVHGTFVMLEMTYALLRFAYERLQSGRVQWKTHSKNIASQKAAVKLGFELEGLHRKQMIHADGTWRNTLFYAMTDDDWFGREETTDARPGLDVEAEFLVLEAQQGRVSAGGQRKLEELVESRKEEGKPLPDAISRGEPLI
ncbi:hypothetical protein BGZ51_004973 [Haplosporangium sp. Z 767]|nr:hypothetical protein BGZ50_005629 [Haplosporangium sp. Z 11]KAF9182099.1 hypothetical protein BGZ51_004973 [Haplosporangium sp. Z 767]